MTATPSPGAGILRFCIGIILLFSLIQWQLNAQIVTIGYETYLDQHLPIEPLAKYSYTQQLFPAEEIPLSGTITHIGFKYNVSSSIFFEGNKAWKIYMGESSADTMQDWIDVDQLSLVFDAWLAADMFSSGLPGSGWLVIPLQQSYNYSGEQNLVLAVDENSYGTGSSSDDFVCWTLDSPHALFYQSLVDNPDTQNPPETFYSTNALSYLRLHFEDSGGLDVPSNLTGCYVDDAVQLTWDPPVGDVAGYRLYRNDYFYCVCSSNYYSDTQVQAGESYSYYVRAEYGGGELSEPSNTFFIEIPDGGAQYILYQSFESLEPFQTDFGSFDNLDEDGSPTWTPDSFSFPGASESMPWISFAPTQCIPPLQISAHSGSSMIASLSAINPPNDDWLILPNLRPGTNSKLSFWARSLSSAYGLERLRVMISTTGREPHQFSTIHSEAFISVPADWTYYEYDISAYSAIDINLAINCVSANAAMLCIDDLAVVGENGWVGNEDETAPAFIHGPNPARESFYLKHEQPFDLEVYNIRGQRILRERGLREYRYRGAKLCAGIYLLKVDTPGQSRILKQVILP
ncbi:MAG: choice-of-anchor J domain-containing protein [Candidatus Cloacimonetes bacterium]|jgi:hypothetical protein|nr:choice-of-anchor J domain-containing protein [Candidatus Cloacimonadota bacterium]MDD4147208.1 choice-of-anchor J domain-containing protein [Candidatus Cloacimonadota bacterium]